MKKYTIKKIIPWIITAAIIALAIFGLVRYANAPGPLDQFATCLKDTGTKFYGAFWCPHCQTQKKMFGKSQKKLPYIECSTPDGKGQTAVCKDANIEGYPTWVFPDNTRLSGEIPLKTLSEKTSCALPQ